MSSEHSQLHLVSLLWLRLSSMHLIPHYSSKIEPKKVDYKLQPPERWLCANAPQEQILRNGNSVSSNKGKNVTYRYFLMKVFSALMIFVGEPIAPFTQSLTDCFCHWRATQYKSSIPTLGLEGEVHRQFLLLQPLQFVAICRTVTK